MRAPKFFFALVALIFVLSISTISFAQNTVYGHWSVKIKPGMEQAYEDLIETEGLPLFRQNAKMVGWWKTLIGDLYEQITIWEYDDISTFENGIKASANNKAFQRFARERNTLITGEVSQFLKLGPGAPVPDKPIKLPVIIHETHIVKQGHMPAYLDYWKTTASPGLKEAGFRIVGPFVQHTGHSDQLLILVCFENLAERDRLLGTFGNFSIAETFGRALDEHITGFHIKVITPTSFNK